MSPAYTAGQTSFKMFLPAICIFLVSLASPPKSMDECEKLQADLKKLTSDLATCRKNIKTYNTAIAERDKEIKVLSKDIFDQELALEVLAKDKTSYKYKALDIYVTALKNRKSKVEKEKRDYEKKLGVQTREETILVNSFHIVRDRIDKECGGVKKDPPAKTYPDVRGRYNSPYGEVEITQVTTKEGSTLTATVFYSDENGGTSKLQGGFDGIKWTYSWRNSFSHYGDGVMFYNKEDRSFKGYWMDKSLKPASRGDWWLRIK